MGTTNVPTWLAIVVAVAGVVLAPSLTLVGVWLTQRASNARAKIEADLRIAEAKQKSLSDRQYETYRDFILAARAVMSLVSDIVQAINPATLGSSQHREFLDKSYVTLQPTVTKLQELVVPIHMVSAPAVRHPGAALVRNLDSLWQLMSSAQLGDGPKISAQFYKCEEYFAQMLRVTRAEMTDYDDKLTPGDREADVREQLRAIATRERESGS